MRVMVKAGGFNYLAEGSPTLKDGDRVLVEGAGFPGRAFEGVVVAIVAGVGAPRRVLEVLSDEVEVEVELTDEHYLTCSSRAGGPCDCPAEES